MASTSSASSSSPASSQGGSGGGGGDTNNLARSWIMACYEMDVQQLSSLLGMDPSLISSRTPDGGTALHIACRNGDIDMVNFLIKNHVDLDAKGLSDQTALHIAEEMGNAELIDILKRAKFSATGAGIRSVVGVLKRQRKALITSMKAVPKIAADAGSATRPSLQHAATYSHQPSNTSSSSSSSASHAQNPSPASSSTQPLHSQHSRANSKDVQPDANSSDANSRTSHLSPGDPGVGANSSSASSSLADHSPSSSPMLAPKSKFFQSATNAVRKSSNASNPEKDGAAALAPAPCLRCSEKDDIVAESRRAVEMLNDRVRRLKTHILDKQDELKNRDDQIASQQDTLQDMTDSLRERHNTVESYKIEVKRRDQEIEKLKEQLQDKDKSLIEVEKLLTETASKLAEAQKDLEKARAENRVLDARMKESLSQERLSHREDTRRLTREVESARSSEEDKLNATIAERNRLKKKNESLTRDLNAMLKLIKKYEKQKPLGPGSGGVVGRASSADPSSSSDLSRSALANHRKHSQSARPQSLSTRGMRAFSVDRSEYGQSDSDEASLHDDTMSTTSAASESDAASSSRPRYSFESRIFPPSPSRARDAEKSVALEDAPDINKAQAFQRLTSELSETILEKEQVIESLRSMNSFLGKRVLELEKKVTS